MQKNNDEWQEIAHVSDTLAYTVTNIEPNIRYRFRVRAENIHGKSEPSECSDYVSILPSKSLMNLYSTKIYSGYLIFVTAYVNELRLCVKE